MTNNEIKALAIRLLDADSEEQVIEILTDHELWDEPDAWRLVGDRDGNFATIGNQQSRPEAALVEKIINSVDARLMNECLVRGISPTSPTAPPSIRHAVSQFFENREPDGEVGGTLGAWPPARRLEQAQFITVAVTGATPDGGNPSITIADQGEGQCPSAMPDTFLSIDRNNKLRIPFVQGKFNMGGTGALKFCGRHSLQLIITRRNPSILRLDGAGDTFPSRWGFTVVRRDRPGKGVGDVRNSVFRYLAPLSDPSDPGHRQVFSFESKSLPLMPENNRPYCRAVEWGSAIKLYEYDMKGFRSHVLRKGGLLSRLELLLPSIALPVRVHECRRYRGDEGRSFASTLVGTTARLEENRGDNLEKGYPTSLRFTVHGEPMTARVYAFKAGKAESYRTNEGVVFVINGQTHGTIPKTFFSRMKVKMNRLANSLLVIVDCSKLSVGVREDLFMNSRDRLSNGDMRTAVEEELQRLIREHPGLRDLRERRRHEEVAARLQDSRPLEEVLRSIMKSSPTLSQLFLLGQRLNQPRRGGRSGGRHRNGGGADVGNSDFRGRRHPTFFRFHRKVDGETLVRSAERGRRCRIKFETDVENDYFGRAHLPGQYHLRVVDGPLEGAALDHSVALHDGIANWTISLPEDALDHDDELTVQCVIRDEAMVSPLLNTARLRIIPRSDRAGETGNRVSRTGRGTSTGGRRAGTKADSTRSGDSTPAGIQMPRIVEVQEDDEFWKLHEFDGRTACKIIQDAEGDVDNERSSYTFYVNVDNTFLKTEMKGAAGDVALIRAKFAYGNVLVGLALIHDHHSHPDGNGRSYNDDDGEEPIDSKVARVTRALGPFLVPMIDYLGALSSDDVASVGEVGDND